MKGTIRLLAAVQWVFSRMLFIIFTCATFAANEKVNTESSQNTSEYHAPLRMTVAEAMQYERELDTKVAFSEVAEGDKSFLPSAGCAIPWCVKDNSVSPGEIYCGMTYWEFQSYGSPQRSIAHAIAPSEKRFVHVIWMLSEYSSQNVHYNCYDWTIPGWTASTHSWGGTPIIEVGQFGGFPHVDVNSEGSAVVFHQSAGAEIEPYSRIARFSIPGMAIFTADDLASLPNQTDIYPGGAIGTDGRIPPEDIYHVGAHDSKLDIGETAEQCYWRYLKSSQVWEGPVPMGQSMLPSHVLAADGVRVIFAWSQARDYAAGHHYDNDLAYWESTNSGADWIVNGGFTQSDWETGAGYNITDYVDADPIRVFIDMSVMFDYDARLHAVYTAPPFNSLDSTTSIGPTVMYHWDEGAPGSNENAVISGNIPGGFTAGQDAFHHIAASAMWGVDNPAEANVGLCGAWNRYISKMTLGIGDGSTICDRADNDNSNLGYLYLCYTLFGGENPADKEDVSVYGYQNGNIYISISPDDGANWDDGRCLTTEDGVLGGTPTRSPGCEYWHYGNICKSEHWGSIARIINDTLHVFYVSDFSAGAWPFGEGSHTPNNLIYHAVFGDGSINGNLCTCICRNFCNLDGIAGYTPVDVAYIVNYVYKSQDARPVLPNCPGDNGDWDCSGAVTPLDVTYYVQYVYRSSGVGPCDPCNCDPYPDECPVFP
jgi:hypothetical protein